MSDGENHGSEDTSQERRRRVRFEVVEWVKTLVFSVVLFFGLRAAVVEAYVIPTGSMQPTIHEGDRVLGSKFHYWFWNPGRDWSVLFPWQICRVGIAQ